VCGAILLVAPQFLTQPGHRTIEVMQIEIVGAGDAIVITPAIGGQIRQGCSTLSTEFPLE
jgi:hypothetical protein